MNNPLQTAKQALESANEIIIHLLENHPTARHHRKTGEALRQVNDAIQAIAHAENLQSEKSIENNQANSFRGSPDHIADVGKPIAEQEKQEPVAIVDVLALAKELGHPCPEADAAFLEDLAKNIAAPLQAQIDRLMLEYCPVEMTPGQLTEPVNQEPVARPFECWSTNDGDSWFEHPADAQIIEDTLGSDAKVGDEFEVLAGWDSVRVTYRITAKSGNEDLADFEVECISHPHNDAAPVDAKAIRAEALEEAAKVCDAIEEDHWNLYKGRKPYTGSEAGRADPHEQGVSMGAEECAAAIRARGLK